MISVIVPTLNEGAYLAPLLNQLTSESADKEIILVDGGSTDQTRAIAGRFDVDFLESRAGRGYQLAAGAARATGDVILFLHADSIFPKGGLERIGEEMDGQADVVGGNFRLIFDGNSAFSRWLTGFYAWLRRRGLYYGDSGIFIRRDVHERMGGIRPIALMEDYDLNRRMEKVGRTICIGDPPLVTSSRKFAGRNPLAIVYGWIKLHTLFKIGVSPDRLAKMYYDGSIREFGPKPHA